MAKRFLPAGMVLAMSACQLGSAEEHVIPSVQASNEVAAGEYLTTIGGCNDCHTVGWETRDVIPDEDRLTGGRIGWRGPWGTSYPANLRLTAAELTADQWVAMTRARNANPPMPWKNLHAMSERDLRAIHAYLRTLGPKGERMPAFVPPDREPATPYLLLMPQAPNGKPTAHTTDNGH